MKSPTEPSKKPSLPLLFQSFGLNDNFHSNYSSRLHPKQKLNEVCSPQPSSECESNYRLAPHSSRKNLEQQQAIFQQHYENMEKILLNQNLNLKQQNAFLTSEVRRSIKHQERIKQEKKKLIIELKQLSEDKNSLENELSQSKQFIQTQISYVSQGLKSNSIQELKNMVLRCIDSFCGYFQFQIQKYLTKSTEQSGLDRKFDQQQSKNQTQLEIEKLTKRLQKLLEQDHSSSKGPTVRRQCIEISKQIKHLKQQSRLSRSTNNQLHESVPNNTNQRSSRFSSNSMVRDNITMRKPTWNSSEYQKDTQEEKNSFPAQFYSKVVTRRKSANRQSKGLRESSPVFHKTSEDNFK